MDFFDTAAPHAVPNPTYEATQFEEALRNRQEFVIPAPSPKMIQALSQSSKGGFGPLPVPIRSTLSKVNFDGASLFRSYTTAELALLLPNSSTMVLDIRPHSQWQKYRIKGSISLSVPSTLLRRPNFSLDKLCGMLPNESDRIAFQRWPTAGVIVVYDTDSTSDSLIQSSHVFSILTKLKAGNAKGVLGFLEGGITAAIASKLEDAVELSVEDSTTAGTGDAKYLSVTSLSHSAFQQGTTTGANQRPTQIPSDSSGAPAPTTSRITASNPFYDNIRQHVELANGITERIPLHVPRKILKRINELPSDWLKTIATHAGGRIFTERSGPESLDRYDTTRSEARSGSSSSSYKMKIASSVNEGMESLAMQFYRIELGEQRRLQGVMDQHCKEYNNSINQAKTERSVRFDVSPDEKVENEFPFSITAGIEKGEKNRYRNVWPFDHARVKLTADDTTDGSDYINASFIQPRGTGLRYIATQGPMESTFADFWTLVWEQHVRIIVMLTKTVEGRSVKCGRYWDAGKYRSLNLKVVREEGGAEWEREEQRHDEAGAVDGFDLGASDKIKAKKAKKAKADMARQFGGDYQPGVINQDEKFDSTSSSDEDGDSIIRREFHLWHDSDPSSIRTVVQFQYVDWPDVNVPPSPRDLLKLIAEINSLRKQYEEDGVVGEDGDKTIVSDNSSRSRTALNLNRLKTPAIANDSLRPEEHYTTSQTLVHCSAGVGRTGSFIVIDALLDGIRRGMMRHLLKDGNNKSARRDRITPSRSLSRLDDNETDVVGSMELDNDTRDDDLQSTRTDNLSVPLFASRSSSSLPEMEGLSMNAKFSSSPPKSSHMVNASAQPFVASRNFTPPSSIFSSTMNPKPQYGGLSHINQEQPTRYRQGLLSESNRRDNSSTNVFGDSVSNVSIPVQNSRDDFSASYEFSAPRAIRFSRHLKTNQSDAPKEFRTKVSRRKAKFSRNSSLLMEVDEKEEEDPDLTPDESPSALSDMDEPVRQVLEGIREQRMSMCQSLRQYVFVHRAIVEGAVHIIDELAALSQMAEMGPESRVVAGEAGLVKMEISSLQKEFLTPDYMHMTTSDVARDSSSTSNHPLRLTALQSSSGRLDLPPIAGSKRLASPTELLKTDIQGDRVIHKRPSLKYVGN